MKKIIPFLFLLVCASAKAQILTEKLKPAFNKFSSDEQLKYATVSFTVLNTETGKIVFGSNSNTGVAPASTLKVITSATALAILGENYRFKTELATNGDIVNGILKGDLIIKGSGDPTLGSDRWPSTTKEQILKQILFEIQKRGIQNIEGKIIADDAIWDSESLPQGWIWQDIGNYYGAATNAVCWGENQFDLSFTPGKATGSPVAINNKQEIYPFLNVINELKTGSSGSGDRVYGYSSPYNNTIYLRGSYGIGLKKQIKFSLPDPALALSHDLYQYLLKNNIKSGDYTTSRILKSHAKTFLNPQTSLHIILSPLLKEIIYQFNQKSINLYGEQLIRVIGERNGDNNINKGISSLQKFWQQSEIALDKNSINIIDGSGLSPANRVSSISMAQVLLFAKKQSWFPVYLESLPINNNMKMKSGTIGDVLAYAGYSGDQKLCFSLIVNNYNGTSSQIRQKMFLLLNSLK